MRPGEVVVAAACVLVLVGLGADVAANGLFTRLDTSVADAVGSGGAAADWVLLVTDIGGLGVSGAIVGIVTLVSAQRSWRWWPVGLTVGVLGTTGALVFVTKVVVGRSGPPGTRAPEGYAGYFPSGHTATSVACLGTAAFLLMALRPAGSGAVRLPSSAARWDRALTVSRVVGVVAGGVVGTGTVLTGYHWLGDVAGGIALGLAVLVVWTSGARGYVCRSADVHRRHD